MKFSKLIVSLVIILNVAFTGAVLFIFMRIGNEPIALIGAWFAFTTGELWLLASIKKKEVTHESNQFGTEAYEPKVLGGGDRVCDGDDAGIQGR